MGYPELSSVPTSWGFAWGQNEAGWWDAAKGTMCPWPTPGTAPEAAPLLPTAAGDTGEMFYRHAPSARTPLVSLNAFTQYLQQTD